jgi:hypothetical protein
MYGVYTYRMSMLCDVRKTVQRFKDIRVKFYGIVSIELCFARCIFSQKGRSMTNSTD